MEISTFLQIPVKKYYEYIESVGRPLFYGGYNKLKRGYGHLTKNYNVCDAWKSTDNMSVFETLRALSQIMNRAWKPAINDPNRYLDDVDKAHSLAGLLIIDSLEFKYPEIFNAEEVKNRYCVNLDDYEAWECWEDSYNVQDPKISE